MDHNPRWKRCDKLQRKDDRHYCMGDIMQGISVFDSRKYILKKTGDLIEML